MGPEAMAQIFMNPDEFIKRLAAASGIEVLGLVKTQEIEQESDQAKQEAMQAQLMGQSRTTG